MMNQPKTILEDLRVPRRKIPPFMELLSVIVALAIIMTIGIVVAFGGAGYPPGKVVLMVCLTLLGMLFIIYKRPHYEFDYKRGLTLNEKGILLKGRQFIPWQYIVKFDRHVVKGNTWWFRIVINRNIHHQLPYDDIETIRVHSEDYDYDFEELVRLVEYYHRHYTQ